MEKYREANINDIDDITSIVIKESTNSYYKTFPKYKDYFTKAEEDIREFKNIIRKRIDTDKSYMVVTINNKVVGCIHYEVLNSGRFKGYGFIQDFYILEEYQHNGYGTKLFYLAIDNLIKIGINKLYVNPIKGTKSIFFYQKLGGIVVSESNFYMPKIVIKVYDVVFNDLNKIKK